MDKWREWTEEANWERLISEVNQNLSYYRFEHTKRVVEVAKKLAVHYKMPPSIVALAALFHDYAKEMPKDEMKQVLLANNRHDIVDLAPAIWHAAAGAYLVQERYPFGSEIFLPIFYHTTGRKDMTDLEKVIFLADFIEPRRNFPGLEEVREATWENLDEAMYLALNLNIDKLLNNHFLIAEITVEARNYFLTKRSAY